MSIAESVADGLLQVEKSAPAYAVVDMRLGDGMLLAFFELSVEEVLEDRFAYARLVDGIRFELPQADRVLQAWRETVTHLLGPGAR